MNKLCLILTSSLLNSLISCANELLLQLLSQPNDLVHLVGGVVRSIHFAGMKASQYTLRFTICCSYHEHSLLLANCTYLNIATFSGPVPMSKAISLLGELWQYVTNTNHCATDGTLMGIAIYRKQYLAIAYYAL